MQVWEESSAEPAAFGFEVAATATGLELMVESNCEVWVGSVRRRCFTGFRWRVSLVGLSNFFQGLWSCEPHSWSCEPRNWRFMLGEFSGGDGLWLGGASRLALPCLGDGKICFLVFEPASFPAG